MWSNSHHPVSLRGGREPSWAAWLDGKLRGDRKMGAVEVVELPRQALIHQLPEPYVAVDAATRRFALANAAAERLLGYSEAELCEMSPADVLVSADGSRLELAYQTVTPGTISRREWTLKTRDGRLVPVSVTSVPIVVDDRIIIQMLSHDLSEEGPAAAQRTLLALANDRLAVSFEYEATLRTIVELMVPTIADACSIDLPDQAGRLRPVASAVVGAAGAAGAAGDDDVTVTVVPLRPAGVAAQARPPAEMVCHVAGAACESATFQLRTHGRDLGTLTMRRHSPRAWTPDAESVAIALARRAAQAVDSALLWETTQRELARRAAILRISRAFAESEPGGDHVMEVLLNEALAMLGADHGGITLWDAPNGTLIQVYSTNGRSNGLTVSLEGSLSGRAALTRRPVISNAYQEELGRATPSGRFGSQAGIAAPLLHEGRLIGVISVGSRQPGHQFGPDDVEGLELLSGMAASMFGTLERAQLQAVSLAARELAHRLNNDLALAVGTIDMLRDESSLSDELRDLVSEAAAGLQRVGEQLTRLNQLARFQIRETPVGPALDLERSTDPGAEPA